MLGLYPTWFEPGVGSGWIIGFIATIHVLFSHASVGGAVLFAWLANFAVRRDKPAYLAFIRASGSSPRSRPPAGSRRSSTPSSGSGRANGCSSSLR